MKTPICIVCGRHFARRLRDTGLGGDLVRFVDFVPLANGMAGHPRGAEWFCALHLEAAQSHQAMQANSAINEIKRQLGIAVQPRWSLLEDFSEPVAELWLDAVGSTPAAVMTVLKTITGWTSSDCAARLRALPLAVAAGSASDLQRWTAELREAGAAASVRYNDGLDPIAP